MSIMILTDKLDKKHLGKRRAVYLLYMPVSQDMKRRIVTLYYHVGQMYLG